MIKSIKHILGFTFLILFSLTLYAQKTNDSGGGENYLKYYKNSYVEARTTFRETATKFQKQFPESKLIQEKVPSKIDTDLTVDLFYIPSTSGTDKIMIISSGVHGVEGFTGSAVQSMFFDKFLSPNLIKETGILFIHSVNPYGYKYHRRVTENNIDMNRNSSDNISLYATINEGYPKVYDLINPKGPVNSKSFGNRFFFFKAIRNIMKAGMPALRQAILQGQYQFPEGLYYGGNTYEPQITALNPIIDSITEPYQTIFALDLHTGYGEKGRLHLFPNPVEADLKKQMESMFAGYRIDWGDSDDFYTVTGDFVNFIGLLNKDKTFIPMVFEYGTMDSQKTSGSIKSIHRMILENQGTQYGYKKEKDSLRIKEDLMEMYYPSSEKWRLKIMKDTEVLFKTILPRYLNAG